MNIEKMKDKLTTILGLLKEKFKKATASNTSKSAEPPAALPSPRASWIAVIRPFLGRKRIP